MLHEGLSRRHYDHGQRHHSVEGARRRPGLRPPREAGPPGTRQRQVMSDMTLKKMHADAVPAALKKAEHYRLLNEPMQAESICRDILEVDPGHKQAIITLVLAL